AAAGAARLADGWIAGGQAAEGGLAGEIVGDIRGRIEGRQPSAGPALSDSNIAQQLVAKGRVIRSACSSERRPEFASRNPRLDLSRRVLSSGECRDESTSGR